LIPAARPARPAPSRAAAGRTSSNSNKAGRAARADRLLHDPDAAKPLPSLIFLSPLLAFYAIGVFFVRPDFAARADILVRDLIEPLGLTGILAPTYIVIGVLILWHLLRREPANVSTHLLGLMAAETLLLTIPIFALHALVSAVRHGTMTMELSAADDPATGCLAVALTSVGAGIYEELLFRLILVGVPLAIAAKVFRVESAGFTVAVVLVAAGIFAGAHTIDDPRTFGWDSFIFRTGAGAYLGYVFARRGFGIAAGAHMVFDLVVKLANFMA
jgi:hypothetical protein